MPDIIETLPPTTYTLAWRRPRARTFTRAVNWSGSLREVAHLHALFVEANPGMEVYWVTTPNCDGVTGRVDSHGILTTSAGRRVRVVDSGTIPEDVLAAYRVTDPPTVTLEELPGLVTVDEVDPGLLYRIRVARNIPEADLRAGDIAATARRHRTEWVVTSRWGDCVFKSFPMAVTEDRAVSIARDGVLEQWQHRLKQEANSPRRITQILATARARHARPGDGPPRFTVDLTALRPDLWFPAYRDAIALTLMRSEWMAAHTHDEPDDVWHLIHSLADVDTPEEFAEVIDALFDCAALGNVEIKTRPCPGRNPR